MELKLDEDQSEYIAVWSQWGGGRPNLSVILVGSKDIYLLDGVSWKDRSRIHGREIAGTSLGQEEMVPGHLCSLPSMWQILWESCWAQ